MHCGLLLLGYKNYDNNNKVFHTVYGNREISHGKHKWKLLINRKLDNLEILRKYNNFEYRKQDICETESISQWKPDKIIHLASMAGVRYSKENPKIYVKTNIEELKDSLYNEVRKIHITRFPYNDFLYPEIN